MKNFSIDTQSQASLNIVVALPCEARPLIHHFKLKKNQSHTRFSIYSNKNQTIYLIVSGVGKIKSAAATTYLHALSGNCSTSTFLNIGIAGSAHHAVGKLMMTNKMTDDATNQSWYLSTFLFPSLEKCALITFDSPQTTYPGKNIIDMEGTGFFQTACLLVTKELVYSVKIISDGVEDNINRMTPLLVEKLIAENIMVIDSIARQLLALSNSESQHIIPPKHFETFQQRWHFTHYQIHELREFLRRWHITLDNSDPLPICQQALNAKEALLTLKNHLEHTDYRW